MIQVATRTIENVHIIVSSLKFHTGPTKSDI